MLLAAAEEVARSAFVLLCGGLAERLTCAGIKCTLPTDQATGACFLALHVTHVLGIFCLMCLMPLGRCGRGS